jgi:spore coat polysaccharide biosynthesis protein SpsF
MLPFSASNQPQETVLEHVINRARCDYRDIIVCTSLNKADDLIVQTCNENKIRYFRGSEENKINRWYRCFVENDIEVAHLLDADDPFFCNEEIDSSMDLYRKSGKVILATSKSKSGNASVGMTLSLRHLALLNAEVGDLSSVEMIDDVVGEILKTESSDMESRDPIPLGTRLTLDYFEDYLALSIIKAKLRTKATRAEIFSLISENPWISELNVMKNAEWKARQARILQEQGGEYGR